MDAETKQLYEEMKEWGIFDRHNHILDQKNSANSNVIEMALEFISLWKAIRLHKAKTEASRPKTSKWEKIVGGRRVR
jgi:hypothetical protein